VEQDALIYEACLWPPGVQWLCAETPSFRLCSSWACRREVSLCLSTWLFKGVCYTGLALMSRLFLSESRCQGMCWDVLDLRPTWLCRHRMPCLVQGPSRTPWRVEQRTVSLAANRETCGFILGDSLKLGAVAPFIARPEVFVWRFR